MSKDTTSFNMLPVLYAFSKIHPTRFVVGGRYYYGGIVAAAE